MGKKLEACVINIEATGIQVEWVHVDWSADTGYIATFVNVIDIDNRPCNQAQVEWNAMLQAWLVMRWL